MASTKRLRPAAKKRRSPRGEGTAVASTKGRPELVETRRELELHRLELAAQNDELRRSNGELSTARERYSQLYDGSPVPYMTLDDKGAIVECNLVAATLLATPRHRLFGQVLDALVASGSRAAFRSFRRFVLNAIGRVVHETILVVESRQIAVRMEAVRISVGPGLPPQCLVCVIDESDRQQTEADRRQSIHSRLDEVDRVESLGTLAGSIAHDLKNILGVVLAHADLVLEGAGPTETRDSVGTIRDAAERATELARRMSAYCGRERLRTEPLDVSALILGMSDLLAESGSPNVRIVLELGSSLPLVFGDRVRLQQIVLNLVVNASEAIGQHPGQITLRTAEHVPSTGSAAGYCRGVVIECQDDGPGMSSTTARRAFDAFFTTKPTGRGLGLAIVRATVRAHGGTVAFETGSGKGTTLRFFLPAPLGGTASNSN